jgi:Ca-activated chloride channel family protein
MRRTLLALLALLVVLAPAPAAGLLIPEEKALPPLGMLDHKVTIAIEDQVAVTRVEQTFRNNTDRPLQATYVFPVPKGATVNKFTMWVDGKETKGELVEADKARQIYTSIVRRTQDPGLLEYIGNQLLQMRVFPVPARGDQKVAFSFTAVAPKDGKIVEYVYPLKNDGKAVATLEKFSIQATVKSQHGLTNVYSPSHALSLKRNSDKEVVVTFDKNQGLLDRDFQLFYSTGKDDIGLTALTHRPISDDKGYFTLLISPKRSLAEKQRIPQDLVLVLDTSGSMRGEKMEQARKALKYCMNQLHPDDRFGLFGFATTVNPYEEKLLPASTDQVKKANRWIDELEATGGTAINAALEAALQLRPKEDGRPFTIIFFTDGQPTIGETNPDLIFKNVVARNTSHTRIFTFGVGDDVNAALLDRLAESTRALSAYVRPVEDIEHKVSSLYSKMSNPVLTNLKLATTGDVKLTEVYPPELPDLFDGGQMVVMGRFSGHGASAIKLTGKAGKDSKEFVYEFSFPAKTEDGKEFVESLWARRKVGYLLDQIRINGEKKELIDEVVSLAKKYGITTPYTSYLIVPDGPMPGPGGPRAGGRPVAANSAVPPGLMPSFRGAGAGGGAGGIATGKPGAPRPVLELARKTTDDRAKARDGYAKDALAAGKKLEEKESKDKDKRGASAKGEARTYYHAAGDKKDTYERARELLKRRDREGVTTGKLGVDLAVEVNNLRNLSRMERSAVRNVLGRNCLEVGGVWIDNGFTAKTEAVVVKALSDAYFRILEKHPEVKRVFQLGNHLVWIAPSGKALVIDAANGKEKLTDAEIASLFVAKK